MKAAWGKFGIEVWPGAGKVKDRTEIVEFTGLELEDEGVIDAQRGVMLEIIEFTGLELENEGGFPVNRPDCQVLFIHGKLTSQF